MKYKHHELGIKIITNLLKEDEQVLAVIIGGSIVHGMEEENSDINIMALLSDEDYSIRNFEFKTWESKSIPTGGGREIFCDIKYISQSYLDKVIEHGNEPSRFAFKNVIISYSKIDGLDKKLARICNYPIEKKQQNIDRFFAQFRAWQWYCYEGLKKNNKYLINHSVGKLILFGGRLILAHNEILYPYHKWFLHELEKAKDKPEGLIDMIHTLLEDPSKQNIDTFYDSILNFRQWYDGKTEWPVMFIEDSEQTWLNTNAPIDDI